MRDPQDRTCQPAPRPPPQATIAPGVHPYCLMRQRRARRPPEPARNRGRYTPPALHRTRCRTFALGSKASLLRRRCSMHSWRNVATTVATLGLVVAACSSAASPPPVPTTAAPATEAPATAAPASPVATVPADQLISPGKLVICSDIPYPPQEMFDAAGNPSGAAFETGPEIAKRLGLTMEVQNSVFEH